MTTRGHDKRFKCGQSDLFHVGPDGVCTSCGRQIREPRPADVTLRRIPEDELGLPDGQARAWFAGGIAALLGLTSLLVWVLAWAIGRMT